MDGPYFVHIISKNGLLFFCKNGFQTNSITQWIKVSAFSVKYETSLLHFRSKFEIHFHETKKKLILRPFNEKIVCSVSMLLNDWGQNQFFLSVQSPATTKKKGGNFSACKLCNLISWSGAWSTMELLNTADSKSKRMNMIIYLLCGFSFMSMMGTFHWGLSS